MIFRWISDGAQMQLGKEKGDTDLLRPALHHVVVGLDEKGGSPPGEGVADEQGRACVRLCQWCVPVIRQWCVQRQNVGCLCVCVCVRE